MALYRVYVVERWRRYRPRIAARRVHERAAGVNERVQRRSQALRGPRDGGHRGTRASCSGFVVFAAVPEQCVCVLGALQEQRTGHDAVEEQRAGQHTAAVHRQGRPFPGGQDIRVDGERHVQAPMGQKSDQLCGRVDQTCLRPENASQVTVTPSVRYCIRQ